MRGFALTVLILFSLAPVAFVQSAPTPSTASSPTSPTTASSPASPTTASSPTQPAGNITLINPLNSGNCAPNGDCLMNFLNKILDFVIRIGTVVVVLMTVYVGYLFVTARGAPDKLTEAKQALLWTLVGALILLGSKAIAEAIKATVQAISVGG